MNYTFHQLQVFLKVAQKQSITKAAEELFLSQPAVSIQLRNFQDQFPIPLTEVVGRRLYVTDFGKEIAEASEKILEAAEAVNYKTLAYKGVLAGRLKLSVVSTGKYVMPYFLAGFMDTYNGVDLIMDVTNKSQVIKSLEKNEVDFALVSVIPKHLKLERIELMKNKLFLIGNTKREIPKSATKRKIFEEYPMIFREEGSATRNSMENYMKKNKYSTKKKIELTSNEALKQAITAGLGYSIMPLIGIKNSLKNNDLRIIPVNDLPIVTHWNLVWLKSKKLSPTAEAFLKYINNEKDRIINEDFKWFEEY
tara:strand:- start:1901 stop:2824 length:924 start_codon:yes stop_codon:yes gene_type:complete